MYQKLPGLPYRVRSDLKICRFYAVLSKRIVYVFAFLLQFRAEKKAKRVI